MVVDVVKHYLQLSKILKKFLYDQRMSASDLAREVNFTAPTIHRLVTGKSTRPYRSSLKPIAEYFSLNVNQLLGEEPISDGEGKPLTPSPTNAIKTIPIVSWESLKDLSTIKDNTTNRPIIITGNVSDDCFALLMNDNSMEPLFPIKSILIFDPHKKPADRSYVLVQLKDKGIPIFRQLLIDIDHKYLKTLNPDLSIYQMRLLEKEDNITACLFESRINHGIDLDNELLNNS